MTVSSALCGAIDPQRPCGPSALRKRAGKEGAPAGGSTQRDGTLLKRLAQYIEYALGKFGQLVKEQNAAIDIAPLAVTCRAVSPGMRLHRLRLPVSHSRRAVPFRSRPPFLSSEGLSSSVLRGLSQTHGHAS